MINEVYAYEKHVKVWNLIKGDTSIFISQWYENGDNVKVVLTSKKRNR